jgi:DNA-binding transcriptional MerR regulator
MGLKIGELAERAEVNLQTLRYYEREKLLPEPPRLSSGYRRMVQKLNLAENTRHCQAGLYEAMPTLQGDFRVM